MVRFSRLHIFLLIIIAIILQIIGWVIISQMAYNMGYTFIGFIFIIPSLFIIILTFGYRKCSNCGFTYWWVASYCPNCGNKFKKDFDNEKCSICGSVIYPIYGACTVCNPIESSFPDKKEETDGKKHFKYLAIVLFVVGLIVIFVPIAIITSNPPQFTGDMGEFMRGLDVQTAMELGFLGLGALIIGIGAVPLLSGAGSVVCCPKCRRGVSSKHLYCEHCGKQLIKEKGKTERCGNCGEWIDEDAGSCPKCGARF